LRFFAGANSLSVTLSNPGDSATKNFLPDCRASDIFLPESMTEKFEYAAVTGLFYRLLLRTWADFPGLP
jgi:hypothetical protein